MSLRSFLGLFVLLFFWANAVRAQDSLSVEQAVQLALEQNFAIKIAKSDAEIAALNNTRANAGMLPLVTLNAADNGTAINLRQELSNGTEIKRPLAFTNNFSTNISATWTLYDGKRVYMEKERLHLLDQTAQLQLRMAMQDVATQTILAWFETARRKAMLDNANDVIKVFNDRLFLAQNRLNAGLGNKVDVLQAQIDVNQRDRDRTTAEANYREAQRNLNALLVRTPDLPVRTTALPALPPLPDSAAFLQKILDNNDDVARLQYQLAIAENNANMAKALHKPRIGATGGYNFQRSDNTAGFLLYNMQHGPVVGLNLSVPLYTGGNLRRQEAVAKVEAKRTQIEIERAKADLCTQFLNLRGRSVAQRATLALDDLNLAAAKEQERIAQERFRLGQTNILELRQAQLLLEQTVLAAQQTCFDIFVTATLLNALAD
jgi:outer membrane protein